MKKIKVNFTTGRNMIFDFVHEYSFEDGYLYIHSMNEYGSFTSEWDSFKEEYIESIEEIK